MGPGNAPMKAALVREMYISRCTDLQIVFVNHNTGHVHHHFWQPVFVYLKASAWSSVSRTSRPLTTSTSPSLASVSICWQETAQMDSFPSSLRPYRFLLFILLEIILHFSFILVPPAACHLQCSESWFCVSVCRWSGRCVYTLSDSQLVCSGGHDSEAEAWRSGFCQWHGHPDPYASWYVTLAN